MDPVVFQRSLVPSEADVDELGHVSNVVYLRWVQEVAAAHSSAVGWELPTYRAAGGVFVVRRHEIEYLRPAFAGDELLLSTWVADWNGASSWRETRVLRARDLQELVRARTLWVFVDEKRGRPRRIPQAVIEALSRAPPGGG